MPPFIELAGDPLMEIKRGAEFVEPGATCVDDVDGEIEVMISGDVDTAKMGEYRRTYTCTDAAGNVYERVRVVTVVSKGKPEPPGVEISR